ncbi:hypothetical protein V6N12_064636 [Hibiscus sabdariffa]|uniref:Uncharacterized protein n=1 Tax=Hibiscus sabdariffa TaxID=183260 RepID=A0ABR2G7R5_9ROSI
MALNSISQDLGIASGELGISDDLEEVIVTGGGNGSRSGLSLSYSDTHIMQARDPINEARDKDSGSPQQIAEQPTTMLEPKASGPTSPQ